MISGASETSPLFPRFPASDVIKMTSFPGKHDQLYEKGNLRHNDDFISRNKV